MTTNAALQYRTQQILTASPAEQVAMLYDEAVHALRKAIAAIDKGDIEARWRANRKAAEIIAHLDSTLNLDDGGEIAQNLTKLYGFMMTTLVNVDLRNDPKPAEDVIALLEPLRRAWHELCRPGGDTGASADTPGQPSRVVSAA